MATTYISDEIYHGFRLVEQRFIKELNADCLHFEHEKSGARLLKIISDDTNKTKHSASVLKLFPSRTTERRTSWNTPCSTAPGVSR
ncbi:MAG: hypothetical protein NTW16_19885 [Bacteroidetes bacterium]|nr:hypothetical protein [Bacteroidota bacterium]